MYTVAIQIRKLRLNKFTCRLASFAGSQDLNTGLPHCKPTSIHYIPMSHKILSRNIHKNSLWLAKDKGGSRADTVSGRLPQKQVSTSEHQNPGPPQNTRLHFLLGTSSPLVFPFPSSLLLTITVKPDTFGATN